MYIHTFIYEYKVVERWRREGRRETKELGVVAISNEEADYQLGSVHSWLSLVVTNSAITGSDRESESDEGPRTRDEERRSCGEVRYCGCGRRWN